MSVACIVPRRPAARVALGGVAAGLLGAAVVVVVATGAGWAWVAATFMAPDVALLLGAGRGLAPGQLRPRAVPLYNALHHPAMDRAAGYGLRTRDGHQAR